MCLGLATGYIKPKEERTTSSLKPYTNNDKLSDMRLDERADQWIYFSSRSSSII